MSVYIIPSLNFNLILFHSCYTNQSLHIVSFIPSNHSVVLISFSLFIHSWLKRRGKSRKKEDFERTMGPNTKDNPDVLCIS